MIASLPFWAFAAATSPLLVIPGVVFVRITLRWHREFGDWPWS